MATHRARRERTVAQRVVGVAVNALLLVVTLVAVAYLVPSLFGYERYVITGGSMSGTIDKGSIVVDKPVPVSDLRVGDVITYRPPPDSGVQNLVTHRIVWIGKNDQGDTVYRTKGDANPAPDPWKFSLVEQTQPVVRFTVPALGWVFVALADRELRMLVIGFPAALVALASLAELLRALRRPHASAAPIGAPGPA